MSLATKLKGFGPSGFGADSTAEQVTNDLNLTGKTYLVTGCNSGLGQETARVLALRGARIVGTARSVPKATAALASLGSGHLGLECDLGDPASVRACVQELRKKKIALDGIIANAGIMALQQLEKLHGFEAQFFTNHIGHFMLVTGLLDSLTPDGRVVMLSSGAHKMAPAGGVEFDNLDSARGYQPWKAYGQSKFANLLFARELARRFSGSQRVAIAVHPGVIATNLGRHMSPVMQFLFGLTAPLFLKTPAQGAATQVFAATHPAAARMNGEYLADCNIARTRSDASNPETATKLWRVSEEIVAGLN